MRGTTGSPPWWPLEAEAEVGRLRKAIDGAPCPIMPCCMSGKPTHADRPVRRCWKAEALRLQPKPED